MEHTLRNFDRVLQLAAEDPEYGLLEQRFRSMADEMGTLFRNLPEQDRDCVAEYLGTYGEMNLRMLELACMSMEFRD